MTEETGWEAAPEDATPLPDVNADPQEVAEQAAAAEPPAASAEPPEPELAGPPLPAEPAPDHVPPPWLPGEGVADWLREAIHELHRRLRALGG